mgnify:CR=1
IAKKAKELYLKNSTMFNPEIDGHWNEYGHKVVFEEINKFMDRYGNQPTKEALSIELDNGKDLNEDEFKS